MDRTSILGDTIDYMKELLERIKLLQEEIEEQQQEAPGMLSVCRELNPIEMVARNIPKVREEAAVAAAIGGNVRAEMLLLLRDGLVQFDVERKEGGDTRVEIYCAAKPGLLLSTVSTLDTLGLDIQQCVISCFNDFGMHASCSEVVTTAPPSIGSLPYILSRLKLDAMQCNAASLLLDEWLLEVK